MAMREEAKRGADLLEAGTAIIVADESLAYEIYECLRAKHPGIQFVAVEAGQLAPPHPGRTVAQGNTVRVPSVSLPAYGEYVLFVRAVDFLPYDRQAVLTELVEKGELTMLGVRLPPGAKVILHAYNVGRVRDVLLNKVAYVGGERPSVAEMVARRVV